MIRVVLAEDSYLVREGVRLLLETVDEVDLVATCESLPELLETVAELEPDVVLTDIRMPPTGTNEGIRAAEQLRSTHPGIGVVVLSQYVDPSFAVGLFAAGSGGRAYLLKERGRRRRRAPPRHPSGGPGRLGDGSGGRGRARVRAQGTALGAGPADGA